MLPSSETIHDETREWLEADGLGGFASGTPSGVRTRRYHALLTAASRPPTERHTLVSAVEAWVETPGGSHALSTHRYAPGVLHPDGSTRLASFELDPSPRRVFQLDEASGSARVEERLFVPRGAPVVVLSWRLLEPCAGARLAVRPLLSGRDLHALQHENASFRFDAEVAGERVRWQPYPAVPAVVARSNGAYEHAPDWYRNFLYLEERARGLDDTEDLASPGRFHFDLTAGPAYLVLRADTPADPDFKLELERPARELAESLWRRESARRAAFATPLHRAADAYLVRRGNGASLVAGYPWFTDWGRDTFLALRGLCLATDRLDEARSILAEWADTVRDGLLPNRFVDGGDAPEYHSVDAPLWFVVATHELIEAARAAGRPLAGADRERLLGAVQRVLEGLSRGTRFGIRADADGLLAAGEPGWQLTWMDAKVDGRVITPRIGKPVEIQALWIDALLVGASISDAWMPLAERARESFAARFWNPELECLHDVVDVDHVPGRNDASVRPNQILAVGGLPFPLLDGARARSVVDAVERELWTPLGLRTLSPRDPRYVGRYEGGPAQRDAAYHQGAAWPWLLGPFVEAWVRVRGGGAAARREARQRFVQPLIDHLGEAGLGHVSELADGDLPQRPRGCPFQAWSLGELLRIERRLAAVPAERAKRTRTKV